MNKQKLTVFALIAVLIASFTVLLSIGSEIYREKPPIPNAFTSNSGKVIFSQDDIEQGQLVWRSMGGHQLVSIWGHGAYVATAFWNLVGAGILGFLVNPPIALYFIQGLNTTASHAHGAFMGVYGMLGIGLMLFCLRGLCGQMQWNEKLLKGAFWTLNIGLASMIALSLLPVGIVQFFAVIEHGYWFARSPEVIHSPLVEQLVWMRLFGDVLFGIGGILLGCFLFDIIKKAIGKSRLAEGSKTISMQV